MKKLMIITAAIACAAMADITSPVVTTLRSDGSTNEWTMTDLQIGLQLMNRKYHRDMKTESGRRAWHGGVVRRVVETNDLRLIEYHEDGYCHTNRWTNPRPLTPAQRAQKVEMARKKRALDLASQTRGVPKAVADARRAGVDSVATSNVTVKVEVK